jgi:hypothetical protein
MWIRLTVDVDLVVHEVEARTDHGPYALCPDIVDNFQVLKGVTIKAGWTQKTRELLGGTRGCTHLVELLGPIATTAFQTIYPVRARMETHAPPSHKPGLINTCHAYADNGPIVKERWPQYYTGKV